MKATALAIYVFSRIFNTTAGHYLVINVIMILRHCRRNIKVGHLLDMLPEIVRNYSFPISYADYAAATPFASSASSLQIIMANKTNEGKSQNFLDIRQVLYSKITPPHALS